MFVFALPCLGRGCGALLLEVTLRFYISLLFEADTEDKQAVRVGKTLQDTAAKLEVILSYLNDYSQILDESHVKASHIGGATNGK